MNGDLRLVEIEARPRSTRRTSSTSFGTPGRRDGHDASAFYARFDDGPVRDADEPLQVYVGDDDIRVGDARDTGLPGGSVALVVTSPPYFAGKEYEIDDDSPQTFDEYRVWLRDVLEECWRILEPGGRIAVNTAGIGRRPYRSLPSLTLQTLVDIGFLLRGEVVWVKAAGSSSMAVGTWCSPHNPVMRDVTERIAIASKATLHRCGSPADRERDALPHETDLDVESWGRDTIDVWNIAPVHATRIGHPAPFPVELPARLIQLHTYRNDLVVDPMCGSGSTLMAARRLGRRFVGLDRDENYCALARQRVESVTPTLPFHTAADENGETDHVEAQ